MKEWGEPSQRRGKSKERLAGLFCIAFWIALVVSAITLTHPAFAHGGGLAADGCNMDRSTGVRHCHRGQNAGQSQRQANGDVYYPNCAAARAAGAAPVRRGQPGYGRHLDRDNDGVGCE